MSQSQQAGPLDWGERFSDDLESIETHLNARQAQIHTSLPGKIVSYDAKTMTATVQPALQAFVRKIDGTREPTNVTTISHVPVHFPGGGGHIMTFPVAKGDDCWLIFSERSIDNWYQHGGIQQPSDWRMHDLNDPVCHVGVRSQPGVPMNVSATTVQLRSDDGKTFVQLDGKNNTVHSVCNKTYTVTDGKNQNILLNSEGVATVFVDGKNNAIILATTNAININAPTVTVNGELHVNGEIWGQFSSAPVSVTQHIHGKGPTNPPSVGTESIDRPTIEERIARLEMVQQEIIRELRVNGIYIGLEGE